MLSSIIFLGWSYKNKGLKEEWRNPWIIFSEWVINICFKRTLFACLKKRAFGEYPKLDFSYNSIKVYDTTSNVENMHFEQKVDILFLIPTTLFLIQMKKWTNLRMFWSENEIAWSDFKSFFFFFFSLSILGRKDWFSRPKFL